MSGWHTVRGKYSINGPITSYAEPAARWCSRTWAFVGEDALGLSTADTRSDGTASLRSPRARTTV
jgi:hypothetical protein